MEIARVYGIRRSPAALKLFALAAFAMPAACSGSDDAADNTSGSPTSGNTTTTTTTATVAGTSAGTTTTGATTSVGNTTASTSSASVGSTTTSAGPTTTSAGPTTTSGTGGTTSTSGDATTTSGGGSGGSGGGATWACPSGISGTPTLGAAPTRVESVPPPDDFNMNDGNFGNIEGPVWLGDALYVSEMSYMAYSQAASEQKMARILKIAADGSTSIFIADSGSNGLALDNEGNLLAAVHKDGSISQLSLTGGAPTILVNEYMGERFNSPNDIAVRSDGTLYFSDPTFQAAQPPPQAQTYVYRLPPGGEVEPIPNADNPDVLSNPNGVTLSLAEDYLYVAASTGKRYPVMADGTLSAGEDFAATNSGDGMVIDCAGNLYVAKASTSNVEVYTPSGDLIDTIMVSGVQVTNVAFGGADHKTLYITGLGNDKGLFKVELDIQGRPY